MGFEDPAMPGKEITAMSKLNPYEGFLQERAPEAVLAETPEALALALEAIGPERLSVAPAPGKWSAAEIACHLADCEMVFGFRLRQTLAENSPTVQPFDQDKWAAAYPGIPAAQALATFTALRQWNLRLIGASLPAAADRPVIHPNIGALTFRILVETIAGHDLNHLAQLQRLAAKG